MKQLLKIDPAAATPIWRQIEDEVRRRVASGRLRPGEAIPSVRELCRLLRVNPATVSKAYQQLTEAGLLEVRRGEGTFVAALTEEQLGVERRRLLDEAAAGFVRVAESVGASREEAMRATQSMWDAINEGGRGKKP
jgi:GntR family transcriptional regulator